MHQRPEVILDAPNVYAGQARKDHDAPHHYFELGYNTLAQTRYHSQDQGTQREEAAQRSREENGPE
jgi:hypothetical protein